MKGRWTYLYRAVDKVGRTIDFYLSEKRDVTAAKHFFRKALKSVGVPRVITLDAYAASHRAVAELKSEGMLPRRVRLRSSKYLNNVIEQEHQAVKRRVNAKQGFREFQVARRTIQGYEAINIMRKGQVRWVSGINVRRQIHFINQLFALAV